MRKEQFGTMPTGESIYKYTLQNKGKSSLEITNLGATMVSLKVPDKDGNFVDVILGYDCANDYMKYTYFFGATIGPNANRIANAKCNIDGQTYNLEANANENNLHSGEHGFHHMIWQVNEELSNNTKLVLQYENEAMKQGFPGSMKVQVTYELSEDNKVSIHYEATSDQDTVANFTNHSYYNLNGHDSGMINDHYLKLNASQYTPVIDSKAIPTGKLEDVIKTPMNFLEEKPIGQEIEADFTQLLFAGGYDHNFCIDQADGTMKEAAYAYSKKTGITMKLSTDCAGMQFYSGNFIEDHTGKNKVTYKKRQGFCLEPQYYPNAINEENFESPLLKANEKYQKNITLEFGTM